MSRLAQTLWLAISLLNVIPMLTTSVFAQSEIRWAPDLATARRAAAQFQVPMLIHFYGDNCLPCKTLEQRVLNQDSVIKTLNKYFICVRINASQDRAAATEYQVHSWPTDVFVSADGQVLFQGVCKQDISGYMEVLQNVAVSNRDRNTQIAADRAKQSTQGQLVGASASQVTPQTPNAQPANPVLAASSAITGSAPATQFQVAPPARPAMMDSNVGLPPLAAHLASQPLGSDGLGGRGNVAGQMNAQKTLPNVASGAMDTQRQTTNNPTAALVSNPYYPESEAMVCTPDGKCGPASSLVVQTQPQNSAQPLSVAPPQNNAFANNPQNKWGQSTASTTQIAATQNAVPQFPPLASTSTTNLSTAAAPTFQPKSAMLVGNTKVISNDTNSQPTGDLNPGLIEVAPPELEPAAFSGFCPISLVKTGLKVQGKTEHAVRHRGRTYLMESPEAVREFMQAPDRYSPVLSGYDPMVFLETGKLVDGTLEHALYDPNSGMIILFSTADSQTKFKADPVRNTKALGYILNAASKK